MSEFKKRLPGDNWFDRVEIHTEPRFKESGLSGDEWRTSVVVELIKKDVVLYERGFGDMAAALAFLPSLQYAGESPDDYHFVEGGHRKTEGLCMQPGCANVARVKFRLKEEFSSQGEGPLPSNDLRYPIVREFCETHANRGDSSREDANRNYEPLTTLDRR